MKAIGRLLQNKILRLLLIAGFSFLLGTLIDQLGGNFITHYDGTLAIKDFLTPVGYIISASIVAGILNPQSERSKELRELYKKKFIDLHRLVEKLESEFRSEKVKAQTVKALFKKIISKINLLVTLESLPEKCNKKLKEALNLSQQLQEEATGKGQNELEFQEKGSNYILTPNSLDFVKNNISALKNRIEAIEIEVISNV